MMERILSYGLNFLGKIISIFPIPDSFVIALDGAIAFFVKILTAASWLIPMNVLILCLGLIFAVDNYKVFVRLAKWLITLVPFIG